MKINIVTDATYYPSKVSHKNDTANNIKETQNKTGGESQFGKILLEKLSSEEAAAIQRLFGDFQIEDVGKNSGGNAVITGRLSSIPRGSFIDIKI